MTKPGKARSRIRTQWLALGAALVVLAGVLVAWALANAADRVQVVQVAQGVKAGEVIQAANLTVADVAFDGVVQGLVPAASSGGLVGRIAAIDLGVGALLQTGMWRDAPAIAEGEESVGAVLRAGRFPVGLVRGDVALAAPLEATATPSAASASIAVRVLDVQAGANGDLSVTLAVLAEQSVQVAQLAATDQLLLIGQPQTMTAATGVDG